MALKEIFKCHDEQNTYLLIGCLFFWFIHQ